MFQLCQLCKRLFQKTISVKTVSISNVKNRKVEVFIMQFQSLHGLWDVETTCGIVHKTKSTSFDYIL